MALHYPTATQTFYPNRRLRGSSSIRRVKMSTCEPFTPRSARAMREWRPTLLKMTDVGISGKSIVRSMRPVGTIGKHSTEYGKNKGGTKGSSQRHGQTQERSNSTRFTEEVVTGSNSTRFNSIPDLCTTFTLVTGCRQPPATQGAPPQSPAVICTACHRRPVGEPPCTVLSHHQSPPTGATLSHAHSHHSISPPTAAARLAVALPATV
ncbi:3-ketoacyl-CoA synthase 6 [Striga asiatica]|uniref:3-ketoacyl-CoA synthase 6 n=1 Tax=Striga asiatica TaxID=4170 RepID=A0A5A7PN40_STRAF|nr:3-ketoacyl-CoA synthase 6 [Striga asiatica]